LVLLSQLIQIDFALVNSNSPWVEHSLPYPLSLHPPLGILESVLFASLINTDPDSSCLANYSACSISLEMIVAPNPYSDPFAMVIASYSSFTLNTANTGPKISSRLAMFLVLTSKTAGTMKLPSSYFLTVILFPP